MASSVAFNRAQNTTVIKTENCTVNELKLINVIRFNGRNFVGFFTRRGCGFHRPVLLHLYPREGIPRESAEVGRMSIFGNDVVVVVVCCCCSFAYVWLVGSCRYLSSVNKPNAIG